MPNYDYFHSILNRMATVPEFLATVAVGTLLFAFVAILYCVITDRTGQTRRISRALAEIFRRDLYTHRSSYVDLWNSINLFGITPLLSALVGPALFSPNVQEWLIESFGKRDPLLSPLVTNTVLYVGLYLIVEFTMYWYHRISHQWPILWSLHRPHHSTEALTILTTFRAHPLEGVLAGMILTPIYGLFWGLLLFAIGASVQPLAFAVFSATQVLMWTWICFMHCHLRISFGWFDYILVSPTMHHIHHSAEPHHRDKNFGHTCLIFDCLFGTLYMPKGKEDFRWGINDQEIGDRNPHNSPLDFWLEPVRHAWTSIAKGIVSLSHRNSFSR